MSFTSILPIIGTGLQIFGQISQARQQQRIFDFNASVSRQKAELARRAGEIRKDQLRREKRRFQSRQTAAFAAAGVRLTGSPLQTIADTAAELEHDIMIEDFNTRVAILNAQSDAELNQIRSDVAGRSGFIRAGTTLLSRIPNFVASQNRARV